MGELSDLINIERVEIIEKTPGSYKVNYKGQEYQITKDTESCWVPAAPSSMSIRTGMQLLNLQLEEIFQDDRVPEEFKEAMIFHEIREREYSAAHFDEKEAHERAQNDEILYAFKFFDEEKRQRFIEFARSYRAEQAKEPAPTALSLEDVYQKWLKRNKIFGRGDNNEYKQVMSDLGEGRTLTKSEFNAMNKHILETLPPIQYSNGYNNAYVLLSALVNCVPESEGGVRLFIPAKDYRIAREMAGNLVTRKHVVIRKGRRKHT